MSKTTEQNLTNTFYSKLIASIKITITQGLISAQKQLEYQRLKTYWQVGSQIIDHVDRSNGELVFGEKLYTGISSQIKADLNLDMSADTILRAIQFKRQYPVFPKNSTLTFTHYVALHRVKDDKTRLTLEKKAIKKNMLVDDLKKEIAGIKSLSMKQEDPASDKLQFQRGKLYIYNIKPQTDIHGKSKMFIDCGFNINIPVDGILLKDSFVSAIDQKRTVHSKKENNLYNITQAREYASCIYTYSAKVIKVIDGDTIDVIIDVGFGINLTERLRFKNIDTPEIKTTDGKRAKDFLDKLLKKCPCIVIRTAKAGMYGRWLADVFILENSKDLNDICEYGYYLNQILIDKGFAVSY